MLRFFKSQEELDIQGLYALNDELKEILLLMDEGTVFEDGGYSPDEFRGLLSSFVMGQRGSLGRTKSGSWSIVPDDEGMDSDVRVEFIFIPTYIVTAILARTLCDYPSIAESIPNYMTALERGMLFCSYRNLYGHGYDAQKGTAEALTILSMGKVPQVLEHNRSLCPKLYKAIVDATKEMRSALANDTAYGMWGESLQEDFSSALETLYIMNDSVTIQAIVDADKGSELFGEEDLPW